MKIKVEIYSASAGEAEAFMYAFQRATPDKRISLPHGYSTWEEPTVKITGAWTITTPYMDVAEAAAMMRDFQPEPVDPLTRTCPACGAEPKEPCRPGCLSAAAAKDEAAGSCPSDCEDCASGDTP